MPENETHPDVDDAKRDLATDAGPSANSATVASYEKCAADYAQSTAPTTDTDRHLLERFLDALSVDGDVLEIGSGPGWDADWLAAHGAKVRRTDAAMAFVELQRARGVRAELLDVIDDDIGGPYAGVLALYVFQHIDRARLPGVLAKIARAIDDGGALLFSLREGADDVMERGSSGSTYYVAEWEKRTLDAILSHLGFRERWSESFTGTEGRWLTILATRERLRD